MGSENVFRDADGNLPNPELIEQVIMTTFRRGHPMYFSLPCQGCGAPMWIRCTQDGIEPVPADEETPHPHNDGAGRE